jgi:hypothetical protein
MRSMFIGSVMLGLLILFARPVMAQDLGVLIGLRSDSGDSSIASTKINSLNSTYFGLLGRFLLRERLGMRVGMNYTTRQYNVEVSGNTTQYKFSAFEIPVAAMYWLSEAGGLFLGGSLALGLDKDCGPGTCQDYRSSWNTFQFGASFKVAPQLGVEVFFEQGLSAIAKPFDSHRAFGVNGFVSFE